MGEKIFSVIIPVYNVEDYLKETIESVINQTIGFDNIELILVNDGSTDNSEEICLEYKDKYPNNVVYIKQDNQGVSIARNNALKYVSGKYVNFLDSDDTWDCDAFEKGLNLFKKNNEISAVIYPLKFFEATDKYHPLHFMFKEDTIVNILEDFKYIKLSSCSTIFKSDVIKGREFNPNLKISEDCRLVTEIFLDYPNIGVVSSSNYNYRKRITNSSTIQTSSSKITWYKDTPVLCYKYLIDLSKEKYGKVINYVQFLLAYDLHWRMDVSMIDDLTESEKKDYLDIMHSLLKEIDDRIIIDFPATVMSMMQKLYMLAFKYENKDIFHIKNNHVYCNETDFDVVNNFSIIIDNIVVDKDNIDIYGRQICLNNILDHVYIKTDYGDIKFEYYKLDKTHANKECLEEIYQYELKGIHAKVDLSRTKTFKIMSKSSNIDFSLTPIFSYSSTLNNYFYSLYLRTNNYYLKYLKLDYKFVIYKRNLKNSLLLETKCMFNLIKLRKFNSLIYRVCGNISKLFRRKPVWLISDRIQIAKDNGQAFFEYLMKQKKLPVKPYFVISKDSKDYSIFKNKYKNRIVAHNTFRHKMLHLASSMIISAQADNYVTNIFGDGKYYIGDLYTFKYVFLQHGITKDDLSPWLNVNSKTIDMFVTASTYEYESFISGDYRYNFPSNWIKLTGFARFDKLKDNNINKEKTILIMPTWRKDLVSLLDKKTGDRVYDYKFKETEYFKFYNGLINNDKLIKYIAEKGYKIRFIPHVNMFQQVKDFKTNPYVEIVNTSVDYTLEFQKNSLLITDYSSVFFDFCYLDKPVIYSQFDLDTFFKGQVYDKGYFSYEKHGFGPICTNIEDTVDSIIMSIENNCQLEQKYKERVDNFYKYRDSNNCKRIYEEILKLQK